MNEQPKSNKHTVDLTLGTTVTETSGLIQRQLPKDLHPRQQRQQKIQEHRHALEDLKRLGLKFNVEAEVRKFQENGRRRKFRAKTDWIGQGERQLSFRQNATIKYITNDEDTRWVYGKSGGQEGWFPRDCVEEILSPRSVRFVSLLCCCL
jgi:hypothetical protein